MLVVVHQRVVPFLAGANSHQTADIADPDLSVADLPGGGGGADGLDDAVGRVVVDDDFDPGLGDEVDGVLGTPIGLRMPALATEASGLMDGEALNPDGLEGVLDIVELVRLDDRGDELQRHVLPGWQPADAGA